MNNKTKLILFTLAFVANLSAQIAIKADQVYTVSDGVIYDGVVLIKGEKIEAVGKIKDISIPQNYKIHNAAVVTPGLIDAKTVVGLAGYLNQPHDQDHLDKSAPIQPELLATDAYNTQDVLVTWLREHGITTIHTGPSPGILVPGQSMICKTVGNTLKEALLVERAMICVTLAASAKAEKNKSPGTRAKMLAMLRAQFVKAQEYRERQKTASKTKQVPRDLRLEPLVEALEGKRKLLIFADRATDIENAIRFTEEFGLNWVLESGAESHMLIEDLNERKVPVILHPTMARTFKERENLSMLTASKLVDAGILVAIQSGYEGYVPKTRVVLFEAAIAAANGLGTERALESITLSAARILGLEDRIGSLEVGKDADVVMFSGNPFEYLSRVEKVFINGKLVSTIHR